MAETTTCADDGQPASPDGGGWLYGAHLDATVYQCGGCGYSSIHKTHVHTHQKGQCPSAAVECRKCTLPVLARGQRVPVDQREGTLSGNGAAFGPTTATCMGRGTQYVNSTVNHNITVHLSPPRTTDKLWAGSTEERGALAVVARAFSTMEALKGVSATEYASTLFEKWKGEEAPERLRNYEVRGTTVRLERGPDQVEHQPLRKHLKMLLHELLQTIKMVLPDYDDTEETEEIRNDLESKDFAVTKKRRVSRLQAAEMQAYATKDLYSLDAAGKEFLQVALRLLEQSVRDWGPARV